MAVPGRNNHAPAGHQHPQKKLYDILRSFRAREKHFQENPCQTPLSIEFM
jgi:hypothetical protein